MAGVSGTVVGKKESAQKRRLEAFITRDYKVGEEERTEWTRVGVAFEHGSGRGYTLHITPGLSVSGELVLREPREKEAGEKDNATS
jgi:hypothetical protein